MKKSALNMSAQAVQKNNRHERNFFENNGSSALMTNNSYGAAAAAVSHNSGTNAPILSGSASLAKNLAVSSLKKRK